jgi:hypothetical protein
LVLLGIGLEPGRELQVRRRNTVRKFAPAVSDRKAAAGRCRRDAAIVAEVEGLSDEQDEEGRRRAWETWRALDTAMLAGNGTDEHVEREITAANRMRHMKLKSRTGERSCQFERLKAELDALFIRVVDVGNTDAGPSSNTRAKTPRSPWSPPLAISCVSYS